MSATTYFLSISFCKAHRRGAALGDVHRGRYRRGYAHAQLVEDFAADHQRRQPLLLRLEQVLAFCHQGVEARQGDIVLVDPSQRDDGLVLAIGHPRRLRHHWRHRGHTLHLPQPTVRQPEGLALGRLDEQLRVEGAEKFFGEVADTIVDRQHDNQRHCADHQPDERYPRDYVHHRPLPAGEKIAYRDERFQPHCLSRRSMFSM